MLPDILYTLSFGRSVNVGADTAAREAGLVKGNQVYFSDDPQKTICFDL
jgi:hypothetical protein